MPDESNLPAPLPAPAGAAPLNRAALERVLARAAELQAGTGDAAEALTEAQILELGQEVGLSGEHLRQALAEERTRVIVPEESGPLARFLGPSVASAQRMVNGTPADVLSSIDAWMQREECLQVKRRFPDRMLWEARRDIVGNIKVGLNLGGRGYALTRANDVAATVVAVDAQRSHVRLDADMIGSRVRRLRGGTVTALLGGAAGAGWVGIATIIPGVTFAGFLVVGLGLGALPIVAGIGGAAAIFRGHARAVMRAQLALEQVLDRLEHGEIKRSSLLDVLAAARPIR